ncbi:MAG: OmpA family protein [Alphaproteobacteria bacterium]|nr:MAG: OmpA family protein [Alphaproteobacteria bacterium]
MVDRAFSVLDREAGGFLNEGSYGNPTHNNEIAQIAYRDQKGLMADLNKKFRAEVPDTVHFAFNSAALDAEAKAILRKQAQWMSQFPEIKFRVYGHTDKVGPESYNKRLGLRRAQAVVRYLTSLGIPPENLEAMASFGETRPVVPTEKPERRNRRAVTEVHGFARAYAGDDMDGKLAELAYRLYATGQAVLVTGGQNGQGGN